jgi:hypothetical protein
MLLVYKNERGWCVCGENTYITLPTKEAAVAFCTALGIVYQEAANELEGLDVHKPAETKKRRRRSTKKVVAVEEGKEE